MEHLIPPHGGTLVNLFVAGEEAAELKALSHDWPSWTLNPRQLNDLELLMNGGFSPLRGFMNRKDYASVLDNMHLSSGELWPVPIVLDVSRDFAKTLHLMDHIVLRDPEGVALAEMEIEEIWSPDKSAEAKAVFGTEDTAHEGVRYLLENAGEVYLAGPVRGFERPIHYDYPELRLDPVSVRRAFARRGWRRVVAFQTRNPMHRAHFEMTRRALSQVKANLLIHPVVGTTKPGDVDRFTRIRCYQRIMDRYPSQTSMLSLLPLSMRLAGPREALWHAIIRKNFGCTHFIVGRDHAGPGKDRDGNDFYGPYDAQELVQKHSEELGVEMVRFRQLAYVPEEDAYLTSDEIKEGQQTLSISGTELRERLAKGREIPSWFTFPEVLEELRQVYPPRKRQGFTVFFTGLSGSGKSTLANALLVKLLQIGGRPVTLLDGDIVRLNLSSELGFSREHRDLNIRRIGFVASEITKNRGVALCAPIAPYDTVRKQVRRMIQDVGGFILVHVATPLEICEQRDRKGLYKKARAGIIKGFTGIDDPYESPEDAELVIDTSDLTPSEAVQRILVYLVSEGYLDNGQI